MKKIVTSTQYRKFDIKDNPISNKKCTYVRVCNRA